MTKTGKRELLAELRPRYHQASRAERTRILDEFVAVAGYHRKHAIRLLSRLPARHSATGRAEGRSMYGPEVVRALVEVWERSDRLCSPGTSTWGSDRLHAFLPLWLEALEAHHELTLEPQTKALLLSMSRATIDRKLRPTRRHLKRHGLSTTKPGSLLKNQIPIRTFAQWDDLRPGFSEVDLVAHCGETTAGEYVNSLVLTDVATAWTECRAVPWRSQRDVFAALETLRQRLPFPLLGLDSDNDSVFINAHLLRYTRHEQITFTRCRPYKKNDQAYIEQKNWSVVRRLIGYDRYEGPAAAKALNAVYDCLRLWTNFFQPSMKLQSKQRRGSKVRKVYAPARTPYQAVLQSPEVPEETKRKLQDLFRSLNPVSLKRDLDQRLEAFWHLAMGNIPG